MRIVRIILIIVGFVATVSCVIMGKFGLASFNLVAAFMNWHFLNEED
jgi:hypothetical protein